MLGAAETFPFTFAWVLVPFVPAQVYSQREGGKGNAAIILQPAGAEDQAKKGRLPQQNGLLGPPQGEDVGCWGAHVGLEYHGAPGSPAGSPKGRASHQDGARVPEKGLTSCRSFVPLLLRLWLQRDRETEGCGDVLCAVPCPPTRSQGDPHAWP